MYCRMTGWNMTGGTMTSGAELSSCADLMTGVVGLKDGFLMQGKCNKQTNKFNKQANKTKKKSKTDLMTGHHNCAESDALGEA